MRLLLLLMTLQTLLAVIYKPTGQPSRQPTGQPSRQPTGQPSRQPTRQPTVRPSRKPSAQPTRVPTGQPSRFPSGQPSAQPSMNPTRQPTRRPSRQPSSVPTGQPSRQPFGRPTGNPTRIPTGQPSRRPSSKPTGQPSRFPSGQPTTQPTGQPSLEPSTQPTSRPTRLAEGAPGGFTTYPTGQPSGQPTSEPSTQPTGKPSLTVCAAGHYGNGVTPCTACPSGRYKSSAGGRIDTPGTLADCSFCPAGSTTSLAISPNFGSYLSTAGSSVSACNLCLPGYYRSSSSCVSCPANTYKSQPGNWASCPLCPAGKVANSTTFCLNVVPTRGDYKPSTAVRAGSNFPHLKYGAFFEASSDSSHASFNISSDSTLFHASIWSVPEYIAWSWSFSPFCLLMFMAGWTCVLLFQVFYALRKKVPLLRCEPHPDDVEDEPGLVIKHRRRLHVAFVVVCATTLSAAHIVMLGFVYMETAANTASAAISSLLGAASTIQTSSAVIQSSAAALSARVSAGAGGACYSPDASSLLAGYSAQLTQGAARMSRLATYSGAYLTLAQTNVLGFYMNTYRIYLIIVFFILAVLLVGGFLLALHLQHVKMLHCLLGATEFVMLGLSLVAAVEVLVVMALGDFCLDPWKYINAPPVVSGEMAQGVLSYYLHCTAPQASPFQSSVNAVNSAVYASSDSLGSIALNSAVCVSEAVQVQALLQTALASTKAIEAATAGCAPVYGQIKSLVEDAVCGIGYTGLLVTFISHVATNGLLLFLLVSASLVFSYRGLAWRMSHKSVHDAAVLEKALRESGRKVLVEIVPTLGGRSFASSRVGVNPTLAELDPNPFRDPLGPSLFSDDEGVGSVDLGAQTEWESARPSQRITIRGSSRRLPQTTAEEEKEWA